MSLHGEIKVNKKIIGTWWATRRGPVATTPDTICTYECTRLMDEEPPRHFTLTHRYGDGAAKLAAAVLGQP